MKDNYINKSHRAPKFINIFSNAPIFFFKKKMYTYFV